MAVASGVIVAWPSTVASIPTGWTRETGMDAKYIQGSPAGLDADLSTSRGSATHTHTSPAHTPIQNSHTHGYSLFTSVGNVQSPAGAEVVSSNPHTHDGTSASATGTNNSVTITVNANSSNDLSYKEVIFIKSDGTPIGIPNGAYAFFSADSLPSGWSRVLGNTYLKGAAAAGNGGGTGGSNTHTHTSPAHTHTQNSHSHGSAASGNDNEGGVSLSAGGGAFAADWTHTHNVSLNATTPTNQSVTTTLSTDSHEPVFKKLNTILNGGSDSLPNSIIALWGGSNASIPSGWTRFTGMDGNFPKGANADGESNVTTGGALTHTHTASNCQPTQNRHLHSGTHTNASVTVTVDDVAIITDPKGATDVHTHTVSVSFATPTNQSTTVTIDANTSESGYPPYIQIIFIQFSASPSTVTGRTTYDYGFSQSPGRDNLGYRHEDIIEKRIWRGERRHGPYT